MENNMERKPPKLLIIGHARHGKDTFAELVVAKMGLSFISSSEFVGRKCIWEQWGKERYAAFSDFFEDRVNHRTLWFNFITAYNTPNLARTGEEMMKEHDVYVGMRNPDEFHACIDKDLFDYVIWVDGSKRHPPESKDSNGMTREMADMLIDNNGPEINLQVAVNSLQTRLHKEGYEVNWKPMEMYTSEDLAQNNVNAILKHGVDPADMSVEDYNAVQDWNDMSEETPLERVYGSIPEDKMIVNPTTEEHQKFHNDALKAAVKIAHELDNVETQAVYEPAKLGRPSIRPSGLDPKFTAVEDNSLSVGEEIAEALSSYKEYSGNFPDGTKDIPENLYKRVLDSDNRLIDKKALEWTDMPTDATKVLDHGFFKVLDVMGSDKDIADAARMSYGRGTRKVKSDAGLINYLVRNYHTSPLEMAEIKFHMRMPIFVMRQWVRHRTANLNEYSGRYSEMVRLWYVPEVEQICLQHKTNKQGSAEPMDKAVAENMQQTIWETSNLSFNSYENMLAEGVSRETARIILPLNTYTEVVWKLDVSNLIKFLRLRDDDHAQWEIRQYAIMVSKAVENHFPLVFAAYQESRVSDTFSPDEIQALITGEYEDLSMSQTDRIAQLRHTVG